MTNDQLKLIEEFEKYIKQRSTKMTLVDFEYEASPEFAHAYLVNQGLIDARAEDVTLGGTVSLRVDLDDGFIEIDDASLVAFVDGKQFEVDIEEDLESDIMAKVERNSSKVYQTAQSNAADAAENMYDSFFDR